MYPNLQPFPPPPPPHSSMPPMLVGPKGEPIRNPYYMPRPGVPPANQVPGAVGGARPKEDNKAEQKTDTHSKEEVSAGNVTKPAPAPPRAHGEMNSATAAPAPPGGILIPMPPPHKFNPLALPQNSPQRFPGIPPPRMAPPPNMVQPTPYQALLGRGGFPLSPYALGQSPHFQAMMSPNKAAQAARNTVMAFRNMRSPNLSPRSNRSDSKSPIPGTNKPSSSSSSNIEFFPKAMNVRNPVPVGDRNERKAPAQGAAPQGPVPPWNGGMMLPQAMRQPIPYSAEQQLHGPNRTALMNQFLQKELYSYIFQTEGQGAADNFVSNFAPMQQGVVHQQQVPQGHIQTRLKYSQHPSPFQYPPPPLTVNMAPRNMAPPPPFHPALPQQQFMAQDLERQWQEESLREHKDQTKEGGEDPLAPLYSQGKPNDKMKTQNNPNFEQFLMPKRQSPFGDGPQPYSRQKAFGEARRSSLDKEKQEDGLGSGDTSRSRPSSRDGGVTSGLHIDVVDHQIASEKDLGQIHIDSPVAAASLTPPTGGGQEQRKVPLYLRRVGTSGENTLPPPRLSYAGALQSQNSSGSTTDSGGGVQTATPLTLGPVTPGNYPFPNNRTPEKEQDPLELLRNLNIKESPGTQALFQYFS